MGQPKLGCDFVTVIRLVFNLMSLWHVLMQHLFWLRFKR